ncbi:DNA topoisomerase IB [Qipengyuania qiaonensis]|uniref:DNA topoisomerase n=1 Tax=Qipengyuania qiaonensis TaxID=2867240 RepID=A0ABS7J4D5_9SPHN|nr:DNA topoisomerase IB [Qipengyuania qiaonensis]MBX7480949.1 DNA topoisomerase IB [Qipengyuania qiaonensis]
MTKLIYVDDDLPGITRKGSGKGWAYYDPKGKLITDPEERNRLNAIALPPAYSDAWFCPAPNGHILATGIDAKGRKQYRYHPGFRMEREGEKFDNCVTFGSLLPLVRKRVEQNLRGRNLTRERAVASVVRLLDLGAVRVGNEGYAKASKSFGATTLRKRHAQLTGKTLRLSYRGKGGKLREVTLSDGSLARMVRKMQDLPGQHLFKYIDDRDELHAVGSSDVNEYLRETMGQDFTAKNFRTWHASVKALSCLREGEGKLPMKVVLQCVADHLGNTPAVTRKSYIHPAVFGLLEDQMRWREELRLPRATRWLTREERGLIDLLQDSPSASSLLAA